MVPSLCLMMRTIKLKHNNSPHTLFTVLSIEKAASMGRPEWNIGTTPETW